MIHQALVLLNTTVFLILSLLHFYWASGGNWAIEHTIPDSYKSSYFNVHNKPKVIFATVVVAIGLLMFSAIIASNQLDLRLFIPNSWTIFLTRIIGGIFLVRAIGDFNLFGLFKKKSTSTFAKSDTKIFIPLCIYLGLSSILITLLNT